MLEIRRARFADAAALAPRLRIEDALEIAAVWSAGAGAGLCYCLLHSDRSFTLAERGQPLALWGVTDVAWGGLDLGIPWLLAAPRLFEHKRELVIRSRRWVDRLLLDVDVLTNLTDAGNRAHLSWLAWCGFRRLRDHDGYGRVRRRFREFYLVNPWRHPSDAGVRELLLSRAPVAAPDVDPAVAGLVTLGMTLLEDPRGAQAALERLPDLLERLSRSGVADRTRRASLRLLTELAPVLVDGAPDCAGRAWCEALLDVAEVVSLGAPADVADVVSALAGSRRRGSGRSGSLAAAGSAARGRVPALARLAGRHRQALTLGGRLEPVQGYRLRAAALGIDQAQARRPLGIAQQDLLRSFRSHALTRAARAGADPFTPGASQRRDGASLTGDGLMSRLRRALVAGGAFEAALTTTFETWSPYARGVGSSGGAIRMAAVAADAVAGRLLPMLRLDGVVSGFVENHGLYRLLRGRFLREALDGDRLRCCRLLEAEVGALLVAADFEARLLQPDRRDGHEAEALAAAVASVWGTGPAIEPAALPALLLPVLAVPVAHAGQLAPALLTWHLTACGRLDDLLGALEEVFSERQSDPRRRFRQVLRRWQRGLDIVEVRSHLSGYPHRRGTGDRLQRPTSPGERATPG